MKNEIVDEKSIHQRALDAVGIKAICERIESGEDHGKIAKSLGMHPLQLTRWMGRIRQRQDQTGETGEQMQ